MTDQAAVDWPTCDEPGCIGIRLHRSGMCLTHVPARRRNAALKQLRQTGAIDARGVLITKALLEQILAATPHDTVGHPTCATAQFEQATFQATAWFNGATFQGDARFDGATFQGDAQFDGATFQGDARFDGATFQGDAGFNEATFQATAGFDGATFQGDAWFNGATFQATAWFNGATFQATAQFGEATFQDDAWFHTVTFQAPAGFPEATFRATARFHGATFQATAWFYGAIVRRDAEFIWARFEQALQLGPLLVYGLLRLDAAHFTQLTLIEASSRGLSCQRTRFPAGVQFRLRGAHVVLDDADLPRPSLLTGVDTLSDARLARREQRLVQAVRRLAPQAAAELSTRPRLLSVQGTNVAGLGLANVDLAECRFAGAHNLDRLRLETSVTFVAASARLPWDWRRVIAEERAWRADRFQRWATPQSPPAWLDRPLGKWPRVLPAGQIAGVYRALRKGREDAKDEPGAADFYYGEMEMRRHAGRPTDTSTDNPTGEVSRGQVERAILTVYWLVSGYGLRAWRALAWLAAVTAVLAVALHLIGFTRPPQPVSYWTSLLYGFRANLSLTDSEVQLTAWGKLLQGLLRLTGPVLLGLMLLAIRARTKR
jgi:hypothetical protein